MIEQTLTENVMSFQGSPYMAFVEIAQSLRCLRCVPSPGCQWNVKRMCFITLQRLLPLRWRPALMKMWPLQARYSRERASKWAYAARDSAVSQPSLLNPVDVSLSHGHPSACHRSLIVLTLVSFMPTKFCAPFFFLRHISEPRLPGFNSFQLVSGCCLQHLTFKDNMFSFCYSAHTTTALRKKTHCCDIMVEWHLGVTRRFIESHLQLLSMSFLTKMMHLGIMVPSGFAGP